MRSGGPFGLLRQYGLAGGGSPGAKIGELADAHGSVLPESWQAGGSELQHQHGSASNLPPQEVQPQKCLSLRRSKVPIHQLHHVRSGQQVDLNQYGNASQIHSGLQTVF